MAGTRDEKPNASAEDQETPEDPPTPVGGGAHDFDRPRRAVVACTRCGHVCRDAHDLRKHRARKRPCQPVPDDLSGACPHCGHNEFGPGVAPGSAAWAEGLAEHCRRRCRGAGAPRLPQGPPALALLSPLAIAGQTETTELRSAVNALQLQVDRLRARCAVLESAGRDAANRIAALERKNL
jgi:hypothetical protein